MSYQILMVDNQLDNLKATKRFLELNNFLVETADSTKIALDLLSKQEYALVLLDYDMPDMMGDTFMALLHEKFPLQQVAMYSCDLSRDALKQSYRAGALDFIEKGESPKEILVRVTTLCARYDTLIKTIRPCTNKSDFRKIIESVGMIGASKPLSEVALKIKKLAPATDICVFIHGETGTGKELVARALHNQSPRAKGPFIAINCAAISPTLIESELFGHVKGAFTGAIASQEGKFVSANGGTIFLDEIADLPLDLQPKLLRVLQERIVTQVGSKFERKIDIRVISATHKNLDEEIKMGRFREDLKYRIYGVELALSPLRKRLDDIEPLVEYFTQEANKAFKVNRHFQYRTLEFLKKYSWPGNIRELKSVVFTSIIEATGNIVLPENLPVSIFNPITPESFGVMKLNDFNKKQNQDKLKYLMDVIDASGSKAEACRRLGITPTHLQYLLNESKASKTKLVEELSPRTENSK